jgi:acyl-CoA thioesterase
MWGDVIEIEARQGGMPIPDCTVSFSLGQTSAAAQPDAVGSGDNYAPPQSIPEAATLSADTLAFMGTWGVVADGISNPCEPYNTTTYGLDASDNGHALFEYESYAEIGPAHWQIDAANVYEGSRFPLTIDLYIDGDTMRQVTTSEDGRQQEAELVRC